MDDRLFLHDNEKLLCNMHPSKGLLLRELFSAVLAGVVVTLVLSAIAGIAAYLLWELFLSPFVYIVIAILCIGFFCWRAHREWKHFSFRVTTDRLLLLSPEAPRSVKEMTHEPHSSHHSFFGFGSHPMHTIKWSQYQESYTTRRSFFDVLFKARPLCIRYGTADAQMHLCFPSLRFANDLKHYLDKVDSAVRAKQVDSLKPFVEKPRGERDSEEM
jgi:hypothetical protein